DYSKETVYSENPLEIAQDFEEAGAEYLHVVDLDGAINGSQPNFAAVEEIIDGTGLKVEIGGGIRNEEIIVDYAKAGALRVIIGTKAVEDPMFTADMIRRHGNNVAVGIDIVGTKVATHGWTKITDINVDQLIEELMDDGIDTVICTDIARDGAMSGTNMELYRKLVKDYGGYVDIVACGGIHTMEELEKLSDIGVSGAIIGRAFYNGALDIREVIPAFAE
ncbi:MAG: HisA/HisF-related TIM barrel protein, partial [Eubacteriales bacterium]|nr:HisA/HisF-related TIM barrel protein [Eubacteriales bacterium]